MTDASTFRRADSAEVADALAYALRYDGNRRVHHADDVMARIVAEYLIRHLIPTAPSDDRFPRGNSQEQRAPCPSEKGQWSGPLV